MNDHKPQFRSATTGQATRRTSGFTLVELMISLFLALLLIMGINAIFKMSADTIGSGLQLSDLTRQLRNARVTLEQDLGSFADPAVQPALIIQGMSQPSFLNVKDERSDPWYKRTGDPLDKAHENCLLRTTDGTTAGQVSPPRLQDKADNPSIVFDERNHRLDMLAFGLKGRVQRQTGSTSAGTRFQTPFTAGEGWIYYAHLRLPTNGAAVPPPTLPPGLARAGGTGTVPMHAGNNPNNFYANQWALGRTVISFGDVTTVPPSAVPTVLDDNGNAQEMLPPQKYNGAPTNNNNVKLAPLSGGSVSNRGTTPNRNFAIWQSRCDVAGTSLAEFRDAVSTAAYDPVANTPDPVWYRALMCTREVTVGQNFLNLTPPPGPEDLMRFHGSAFLSKSATLATMQNSVALTAPIFIKGCSQFMVEFAGDYVKQDDTTSAITGVGEDGALDFDLIKDAGNPAPVDYRKIRWYGLTRSTDGGGVKRPSADDSTLKNPPKVPQVIHPLYEHLKAAGINPLPFEKLTTNTVNQGFPDFNNRPKHVDSYTCAWSPDDILFDEASTNPAGNTATWLTQFPSRTFLPWLIRITIRVDDPYGRLPDGQTMEFVFKLPRPSL